MSSHNVMDNDEWVFTCYVMDNDEWVLTMLWIMMNEFSQCYG
jgi:hypothetical protein